MFQYQNDISIFDWIGLKRHLYREGQLVPLDRARASDQHPGCDVIWPEAGPVPGVAPAQHRHQHTTLMQVLVEQGKEKELDLEIDFKTQYFVINEPHILIPCYTCVVSMSGKC